MRVIEHYITQCSNCKTTFTFTNNDTWLGGYGDPKVICPFCKETIWYDIYEQNRAKKKLDKLIKKYGSIRFETITGKE